MTVAPRLALAAALVVAVFSLGACSAPAVTSSTPTPTTAATETPSPSPTAAPARPTLEELRLTPAGLGNLVVGAPVPETAANIAIVQFDPRGCLSDETSLVEGDPGAGFWRPAFPDERPFQVVTNDRVKSAPIINIQVASPAVFTDTGIHVGSSVDAVLAAYPGISVVPDASVTQLYVVDAPDGMLAFEVANAFNASEGYWQPQELNTVVYMTAYALDQAVYAIWATDSAGACTV